MKGSLLSLLLIMMLFAGCIPEDQGSDQIRGLIFEPSYGIESPQIISITQTGNEINIHWNRVLNASFYHLYTAINYPDLFTKVETTFSTSEAIIKNLETGKTYYFYVTAINEFGVESDKSNIVSLLIN